jgi:hypothetical protein
MIRIAQRHRHRPPAAVAGLALALLIPNAAFAHGPDPLISATGTLWSRDQVVPYQWHDIYPPPAWMATAINLGAGDVAESRDSRAATFIRAADAAAVIQYSGPLFCGSGGIACADRTGMSNGIFRVQFRPQGWAFDWGTLKWCQYYSLAPSGCYDAETTALDELGHIEILGHHVNFADDSDYLDAIVQVFGRQKPRDGWNAHAFGRCDVARLQLEYERRDPGNLVSTCLALGSSLGVSASTTYLVPGSSVRFTANLKLAVSSTAGAMSGDPLSDRSVALQRRAVGGTTWGTVGTMAISTAAEGTYGLTIYPTATYDYRASFSSPTNEGVSGSTSGIVRVTVASCSGTSCPASAPLGGAR